MIFYGSILALFYSFVRGLGQGIEMYLPSNRIHPWFGFYHWLRVIEALLLIGATKTLWNDQVQLWNFWFLLGLFVLGWELFELGYAKARMGQVKNHENVLGLGGYFKQFDLNGVIVVYLHIFRWVLGLGFLTKWRL